MKTINDLIVDEISGVGNPAQKLAVAAVIKEDSNMAEQEQKGLDTETLIKAADDKMHTSADVSNSDPVVYTTKDGGSIRKSAGEETLNLAKTVDALAAANVQQAEELAKMAAEREAHEIAKQADELIPNFPGDAATRQSLIKAVRSLPAEERESVEKMLAGPNNAYEFATTAQGHSQQMSVAKTSDFDQLVKEEQKISKSDHSTAYMAVLDTDEGRRAFRQKMDEGV